MSSYGCPSFWLPYLGVKYLFFCLWILLGIVEITGPPEFLNNCAAAPEETTEALGVLDRRMRNRSKRDRKDLPAGG